MSRPKSTQIALKDVAKLLNISYDRLKNMYPYLVAFPAALPRRNLHCKVCFNKDEVVAYANSNAFNAKAISAANKAHRDHLKNNPDPKKYNREPAPTLDLELVRQFLTAKPVNHRNKSCPLKTY